MFLSSDLFEGEMAEFRKECAFPTRLWKKDPEVEAMRKEYLRQQADKRTKLPPAVPPPITTTRQSSVSRQRSVSLERISLMRRSRTGSVSREPSVTSRSGSRTSQTGGGTVKLPSIGIFYHYIFSYPWTTVYSYII